MPHIPAVSLGRVSTTKQGEGESLEVQHQANVAAARAKQFEIVKCFDEEYSGRKSERPVIDELVAWLKANKHVKAVFIRFIDRMTRTGAPGYHEIKDRLAAIGVQLFDTLGVIQPSQNTLNETGFEYDWSLQSPSRITETVLAETGRQEVTMILTRMIGQEIRLTKQGYSVRQAPIGYQNERIENDLGKKYTILAPHPIESHWIIRMFELRAEGVLSDEEICDHVNAIGYKSRVRKKRAKNSSRVIGTMGGVPLDVATLQRLVQAPIYAGIRMEKWTNHLPVRCPHPGLVSVLTFNRANRGKIKIVEIDDDLIRVETEEKENRIVNHPDYPFRFVVRCPKCRKQLVGSASKGQMGQYYKYYHCHRCKGVRYSADTFHQTIADFGAGLSFSVEFLDTFHKICTATLALKRKSTIQSNIGINQTLIELQEQQQAVVDQYVFAKTPLLREKLEERITEFQNKIELSRQIQKELENADRDIDTYMKFLRQYIKRPAMMLLDTSSPTAIEQTWSLFFQEFPTYSELVDGTAKLSVFMRLAKVYDKGEKHMASLLSEAWNEFMKEVKKVVDYYA